MIPNVIALAVPLFLAGIVLERWILARRGGGGYRFGAAISDLDTGIASQAVDVFLKVLGLLAYTWAYLHFRWFTFAEGNLWVWVVGLVAIDFFYYWWHRLSHVVNALWAVHAVHHQSEEFNLAVALRQPAFEAITIIPFHLPLALLGVPPAVYVVSYSLDLVYQFWVHTELVGRPGILGRVLNTPSAHRVHHGINPRYLDKNYGGILILWDRLFGTFEPEEERVVYGTTKPLQSYNPVWANLAPFGDLFTLSREVPGIGERLRVFVAHPAWRPEGAKGAPARSLDDFRKYDPKTSRRITRYVAAHFLILLAGSGAFMFLADRVPLAPLVVPGLLVLVSAAALGGWCEGRRWARPLDLARQLAIVLFVFFALRGFGAGMALAAAAGTLGLFSVLFLALAGETRENAGDAQRL